MEADKGLHGFQRQTQTVFFGHSMILPLFPRGDGSFRKYDANLLEFVAGEDGEDIFRLPGAAGVTAVHAFKEILGIAVCQPSLVGLALIHSGSDGRSQRPHEGIAKALKPAAKPARVFFAVRWDAQPYAHNIHDASIRGLFARCVFGGGPN